MGPNAEDWHEVDDEQHASETDWEAPEADAMEQRTAVDDDRPEREHDLPLDADEADVAEQDAAVELDEDDYR